jgi:outer membrane protein
MTKKLLSLTFAFLCAATMAQAQTKLAVVDLNKAFNDYYKTKEVENDLKEQMNKFRKDRDDQMASYRTLVEQIQALQASMKDATLSPAAQKEKETNLNAKIQDARTQEATMKNFEGTTAKLLQDQSQRQRAKILKEITDVVTAASKGQYDLVLDISGQTLNGTGTVVYVEDKIPNMTDAVIKTLNKDAPKDGAAPAAKN